MDMKKADLIHYTQSMLNLSRKIKASTTLENLAAFSLKLTHTFLSASSSELIIVIISFYFLPGGLLQ
jgi:hypothetical protein